MLVTVFLCTCDHVFMDFVTRIVGLGTGVLCKCTCVNKCSHELLPNLQIVAFVLDDIKTIQCLSISITVLVITWQMR